MITHVLLRNWRGYEKLNLDLGPGLTFVVADNGVGKTSLVHGAAWALFGDASGIDGAAAIRAGAAETTAEVELVVGDARLTIERSLARGSRPGRERLAVGVHRPPSAPGGTAGNAGGMTGIAASLDDDLDRLEELGAGTGTGKTDLVGPLLLAVLVEAMKVPPETLPQLMFVPEMRLTHEGELFADVQDHLSALLGIDSLRRAARTARTVVTTTTRQLRQAKDAARVDQAAAAAAQSERGELRAELAALDESIDDDVVARDRLELRRRRVDAWHRYDEQLARHQQRMDDLAEQARAVGIEADPDAVATAAHDLTQQSNVLRDTLGQARAEGELVEGLVAQLGSADPVCPVCLRPVDDDTAHRAAETHQARLTEIAARESAAQERQVEIEAAARRIMTIAGALSRQRPPEPPAVERPDVTESELLSQMTELDATLAAKRSRRGALGERLLQAELTVQEADQTEAATAELTRLHAVAGAASSLADMAQTEADARTERSLDPLSRALAERWTEFFGTRSSRPRLAGRGTIELGGHTPDGPTIPYSSFSGGEKTLASLLTRLLFVTSATELRTMWLDEPLEHLDPANRTRLARLAAQATRPGNHMQQIVVTTYEEHLARTMADRHDAKLLYVSTDDLL